MPNPLKPMIKFEDFAKIDLRVATVVRAEYHPNADRLLKLHVDDGTPEGRQICAGIRGQYEPEQLVGRQVIIVANLEPKTIRGEISNGMMCVANDESGGEGAKQLSLLAVEKPVPVGSQVS